MKTNRHLVGRSDARDARRGVAIALLGMLAGPACVPKSAARSAQPRPASAAAASSPAPATARAAVDPCVDFAEAVCGPGLSRLTLISERRASRAAALVRFLDELAAGRHLDGDKGNEIVREFYRRCNDVAARNAGLDRLRAKLDEIARVRTLPDLARALGALRATGPSFLVRLGFSRDPRMPDSPLTAVIGVGGAHLPRAMYGAKHRLVEQQRVHWQRLALLSGAVSADEVESAVAVDAEVAKVLLPRQPEPVADPAPPALIDRRTLAAARFPWVDYLDGLAAPPAMPLRATNATALARVDTLADLPLEQLKSYVRVRLIEVYSEYLTPAFLEEEQRFHVDVVSGWKSRHASLSVSCAGLTAQTLEPLLADAYLSDLADPRAEALARRMFEALRTYFASTVYRARWLDPASRDAAVAKVSSVKVSFIGDVTAKEPDLSFTPGSFLEARLQVGSAQFAADLAQVGKPLVDRVLRPSFRAASYTTGLNTVWLSPHILQPPFLRPGPFDAFSYGAVGPVIGHELAHAITNARRFDASGVLRETWSPEAVRIFDARTVCLAHKFDAFASHSSVSLTDGPSTLFEDLADLLGVQVALQALDADARRLVSADAVRDARREFFVAYAQTMCTFSPDSLSDLDALRDPHSERHARINGALANTPAFADTFACRDGSPMAPRDRCAIW